MEYRSFEIQLCHADDVKKVNLFTKMRLYTAVSISSTNTLSVQKSPVAKKLDKRSFACDFSPRFYVEDWMLQQNQLTLKVELKCKQLLGGDKKVGKISIPLKKLFDHANNHQDHDPKDVIYDRVIIRSSGKHKGVLYFAYSFGNKIVDDHVVVSYNKKMASSNESSPTPSAPPLESWID